MDKSKDSGAGFDEEHAIDPWYNYGMGDGKKRTISYWRWAALLLAVYVSGYYALADYGMSPGGPGGSMLVHHTFKIKAIQQMYWPLGWLECQIRQMRVYLYIKGDDGQIYVPTYRFDPSAPWSNPRLG